jgi:hypothetical protein
MPYHFSYENENLRREMRALCCLHDSRVWAGSLHIAVIVVVLVLSRRGFWGVEDKKQRCSQWNPSSLEVRHCHFPIWDLALESGISVRYSCVWMLEHGNSETVRRVGRERK